MRKTEQYTTTAMFILAGVFLAVIVATAGPLTIFVDPSTIELPGVPIQQSPFASYANDTLDPAVYPAQQSINSTRPYIVTFDYSDLPTISYDDALTIASSFINDQHPEANLTFYPTFDELGGPLPHWFFSCGDPWIIVELNALTGRLISYQWMDWVPNTTTSVVLDKEGALSAAKQFLDKYNYTFPSNTRYYGMESNTYHSTPTSYKFYFYMTVGPVVVGPYLYPVSVHAPDMMSIQIDASTGQLIWFNFWAQDVNNIPLEGLIKPELAQKSVLANVVSKWSIRVLGTTLMLANDESWTPGPPVRPFNRRLCWVVTLGVENPLPEDQTHISKWMDMNVDAFTGEVTGYYSEYASGGSGLVLQVLPLIRSFVTLFSSVLVASVAYTISSWLVHRGKR